MKRLILFFLVVFVLPVQSLWADCLGCCSGHGGVVCVEGVTRCADGTGLSETCLQKNCELCSEEQGSTPPDASELLDNITIASFNIQVFGTTKAAKVEVMKVLAKTIARFDIVAI